MSSRRARIKVSASLTSRRKNADVCANNNKQNQVKDGLDNNIKSPKTPRTVVQSATKNNEEKEKPSPSIKTTPTPLLQLSSETSMCDNVPKTPILTEHVPKTPNQVKVPSPALRAPTPVTLNKLNNSATKTPKLPEKVSVITTTSVSKTKTDVFASPYSRKDSPDTLRIVSPSISSPKIPVKRIEVIQRSVTSINNKSTIDETIAKRNELQTKKTVGKIDSSREKISDVPDDYNPPSVPESVTDEAVMDGIVPLQPARSVPKPIDLLKNEIISENAEVLFDPIVPLPSPSKVRQKLRPAPRLAPYRRNSVQGSASESEDESRRALLSSGGHTPAPTPQRQDSYTSHGTLHSLSNREVNRVRNDSICSNISQATTHPPLATSPLKDKHLSKSRRQEMSRRMAAMRRRRETVKRDALTMYDLIFYNPTTNPIVPDPEELKAKEANEKAKLDAEKKTDKQESEEDPDDPPAAPAPRIKLGPNGEIVLDESSLVIQQSESKRRMNEVVVHEGAWSGGGGGRYSRSARTADWSAAETVRFYRALAAIGTDFSLMAPLFPDRTRKDLKLKFKKEERLNGAQVDKALRSQTTWDVVQLQTEFSQEREAAARRAARERELLVQKRRDERHRMRTARELRVRQSRGAKAVESTMLPGVSKIKGNEATTADEIIQRALEARERKKRKETQISTPSVPTNSQATPPQYATLTLISKNTGVANGKGLHNSDMATISRLESKVPIPAVTPENFNPIPAVPSNIETGSLVVLTVNDPTSPSKKMLQTYISHGAGRLTPVALPTTLLNSVVGYMRKGTPKNNISTGSSPQLMSPASVASQDNRTNITPGVQINPSPMKRQRHSSYTITQL